MTSRFVFRRFVLFASQSRIVDGECVGGRSLARSLALMQWRSRSLAESKYEPGASIRDFQMRSACANSRF